MNDKLFVIIRRCGRLANRLGLFANFIALAEEQGYSVINPTFHSYATLFKTTRADIYCRYPAIKQKSWLDAIPGVACALRSTRIFHHTARAVSWVTEFLPLFGKTTVTLRETDKQTITSLDNPEIEARIRDARIVFVNGWKFRAPDYVQRHAEKIRAYFRPIQEYEQSSYRIVNRLRQEADVVVGVHIRHGDYRRWRGGQCFFPAQRYAGWMHELAEQFPARKVSFLICSDEPQDERKFPGLSVELGSRSPLEDLYALANCDYVFGPLSTYSQWASFYGGKPLFQLDNNSTRLERERFRVSYLDLGEILK